MHSSIRNRSPPRLTRGWAPTVLRAMVELGAALWVLACATTDRRSTEQRAADQATAEQVQAALQADQKIYARHIDVDAKDGVAWLTGWVLSADEEEEAVQTSAAVPGVRHVVDGLEVKDYFPH